MTAISHLDGGSSLDIMGRAVVLAFRLSSVKAPFPGVAVQGEVVEAYRRQAGRRLSFKKWNPGVDGLARYFKKERWGTASISVSYRAPSALELTRDTFAWQGELARQFEVGPVWCRQIFKDCFG